jgi:hypothetical protein
MHFSACEGSTFLLGSSRVVSLELSCSLSCRSSSLSLALELRGVSLQISRDFVEDIMVQGARMKDVLQQLHNVAQVQYHSSVNFAQMHIYLMSSRGQLFYWLLFRWFRRFPNSFWRFEFQILMHAKIVTY